MNTNKNTIEITDLTDLQLDAMIALKTGDNAFPWDSLTVADLIAVQDATGANLRAWIQDARNQALPPRKVNARDYGGRAAADYYENAILARQERDLG